MSNKPNDIPINEKDYNEMTKSEKVIYFWDWIVRWSYTLWWIKIKISDLRKIEPNIEELFPLIEENIREYSPELWINAYVVFDDTPNQEWRNTQLEWINFDNTELSEKIWDLFYNSLSDFLNYLSDELKQFLENVEWWKEELWKVFELIKKASNNINEAWNICEPYIRTDFEEMKHTDKIKWVDISNNDLAKLVWNLVLEQLGDFLIKLSIKLNKDWKADELRWRTKLANELHESSKNLELAWNIILGLSKRVSSYSWESIEVNKKWILSSIFWILKR